VTSSVAHENHENAHENRENAHENHENRKKTTKIETHLDAVVVIGNIPRSSASG